MFSFQKTTIKYKRNNTTLSFYWFFCLCFGENCNKKLKAVKNYEVGTSGEANQKRNQKNFIKKISKIQTKERKPFNQNTYYYS